MSLAVALLAGADSDLQTVFNKLEDYREGLGTEFMIATDAYLTRITTFPQIAPLYFERIRRQVMQKFPYGIFYEPQPSRILVFAILDLRQDTRKIIRRLQS